MESKIFDALLNLSQEDLEDMFKVKGRVIVDIKLYKNYDEYDSKLYEEVAVLVTYKKDAVVMPQLYRITTNKYGYTEIEYKNIFNLYGIKKPKNATVFNRLKTFLNLLGY